jgi:hypothetical protein
MTAGNLAARQLVRFMEALNPDRFDVNVGPKLEKAPKTKRGDLTPEGLLEKSMLSSLKGMNARGSDIYFRPLKDNDGKLPPLAMVDDLDKEQIQQLDQDIGVAAVVETSPNNYQAWVRLRDDNERVDEEVISLVRRYLTHAYGGDEAASKAADQAGKLPGFTNMKPERRKSDGHAPFAICRHADGTVPSPDDLNRLIENVHAFEAEHGLTKAEKPKTQNQDAPQQPKRPGASMTPFGADAIGAGSTQAPKRTQGSQKGSKKPHTPDLPADPRQAFRQAWDQANARNSDNSACDFVAARDLAKAGFSEGEAINALRQESPGLEDRGKSDSYPEHTVRKAFDSVADQVPNVGPDQNREAATTEGHDPDHDGPSGPGM